MTPTSAFRLSKQTKRLAASILDNHKRGWFIKLMIQSQLCEEDAARKPLKMKDKE